jgi:SAM-dependent methyltransferase
VLVFQGRRGSKIGDQYSSATQYREASVPFTMRSQDFTTRARCADQLEQAIREGQLRLYPSLTNPHWLVLKKRREIFEKWIATLPQGDLLVLDIGGRIQPYRRLLTGRTGAYIGIDLRPSPLVGLVARGQELPFADNRFDLVLCTQMLQYTREPKAVVNEAIRVLKPGGAFFLSVPSAYPIDSEEECWRFLPAGLRHLLADFDSVQIVAEGGSVAGFFRTVNACLNIFVRYPSFRSMFRYTANPAINLLGAFLEKLSGSSNEQFAVNYSVLARK